MTRTHIPSQSGLLPAFIGYFTKCLLSASYTPGTARHQRTAVTWLLFVRYYKDSPISLCFLCNVWTQGKRILGAQSRRTSWRWYPGGVQKAVKVGKPREYQKQLHICLEQCVCVGMKCFPRGSMEGQDERERRQFQTGECEPMMLPPHAHPALLCSMHSAEDQELWLEKMGTAED